MWWRSGRVRDLTGGAPGATQVGAGQMSFFLPIPGATVLLEKICFQKDDLPEIGGVEVCVVYAWKCLEAFTVEVLLRSAGPYPFSTLVNTQRTFKKDDRRVVSITKKVYQLGPVLTHFRHVLPLPLKKPRLCAPSPKAFIFGPQGPTNTAEVLSS